MSGLSVGARVRHAARPATAAHHVVLEQFFSHGLLANSILLCAEQREAPWTFAEFEATADRGAAAVRARFINQDPQ